MYADQKIWIGNAEGEKVCILPQMANRHGLIAGATGTGKTVTLKVLAESFSDAGVPVFLADVKGDLAGMCCLGAHCEDMQSRIQRFGLDRCGFQFKAYPSVFWDVYGEAGIPLRTTISEMGPVLLAKLLELNQTQTDVLTVVFKIADDRDLLLIDTKDLKAMLQYVADHNKDFALEYGNIAKQTVAAIMRSLVALEAEGAEKFFTEPALQISDWFTSSPDGRGTINILDCRRLVNSSSLYSAFLLWMLSELFETLPEVGDPERPRMVFFFDEAHLLFDDISKTLQNKIEQVIKLIRSKGVGIYFVTQNPGDIPGSVLAQLGNRIQHALRAYTPAETKALKAAADSFRTNPAFDTRETLISLGTGEALVSVLDQDGIPGIVKKCSILPPQSLMGPIGEEERRQLILQNNLFLKYQSAQDPDSAYEFLMRQSRLEEKEAADRRREEEEEKLRAKEEARAEKERLKEEERRQLEQEREAARLERERIKEEERLEKEKQREAQKREKAIKSTVGRAASTAAGTIGREFGNSIGKQVGGSLGKKVGGNVGASLGRSILGTFLKF